MESPKTSTKVAQEATVKEATVKKAIIKPASPSKPAPTPVLLAKGSGAPVYQKGTQFNSIDTFAFDGGGSGSTVEIYVTSGIAAVNFKMLCCTFIK